MTLGERHLRAAAAAALLMVAAACSTVPYTGRSQLNFMSRSEETALGLEAADKVLRTERPSRDGARIAQVRRVGGAIAAVAGMTGARWEFYVIEKKEPNAFCLPGGIVFVNNGLFPYVKNDDQLAAVIGHEVAHALAHHGAERVSQRMAVALPGVAVATVLGSESPALGQAFASVYGIGANVGYVLPHSRQQESEADRIGLVLMAKAGYDPGAAVGFWNNMRAAKGSKLPEFLSTHPADERRIQNIIRFLPEARSYIPASVPPPPDDDPPPGVAG